LKNHMWFFKRFWSHCNIAACKYLYAVLFTAYKYLMNVFLEGRLELSNNRAERSVKSFVIGRKAWLFSCTPDGAVASSIMYSILETAKENKLHPYHYLKFLLETLPNASTSNLEALLPWSESLPEDCYAPAKKR